MKSRILCVGAGGHASVVIDLLQVLQREQDLEIVGLIDRAATGEVLGVPVLGTDEDLARIVEARSATHFIVALGTLAGGAGLRPRLFAAGRAAGLEPFTALHPSATVSGSVEIGAGSVVMAGCVIQPRVRIGCNAIINTRAGLDHDCVVGDHAHVAPGVTCSGGAKIGEAAHIGAGATLLQNVEIGAGATVGAGALVDRNCEAGATIVGVPARPQPRPLG